MDGVIVLCSGGLDSVTAAFLAKRELSPEKMILMFCDYGQRALMEEWVAVDYAAQALSADLLRLDLRWLGNISTSLINASGNVPRKEIKDLEDVKMEQDDVNTWWVPCRNGMFVMAALAHAESLFIATGKKYSIVMGIKKEGQVSFKDSRPEFIVAMNEAAKHCTSDDFEVLAPLMELDKDEIVRLAMELSVPLELTYSCYVGKDFRDGAPVHCGVCSACRQRQAAFYWAGVEDPTIYDIPLSKDSFD